MQMPKSLRRAFLLLLGASQLSGCGGIADSLATHQFDLRLSRRGQALSGRSVSVAMQPYDDVPFTERQQITTDSGGAAHAEFKTMWGSAFFVIPPIGSVPSRPPKPVYTVTVSGKEIFVSSHTLGATYRWEHDSWHTQAPIDLP